MSSNDPLISNMKIILGVSVDPEILDYIKSMKHEEDLEEFMATIVDKSNRDHVISCEAIKRLLFKKSQGKNKQNVASAFSMNGSQKSSQKSVQQTSKGNKQQQQQQQQLQQHKGKKKFSDINAFQEKKKQKEGRTICDCEGQEHEFMNNCLNCGRLHCVEEGPGPCFFCGVPIYEMGQELFDANSRTKSKKNKESMKHKENKVFDDDNDFFKTKKPTEEGSKKKLVVALDFATRRVIESTEEDVKLREKLRGDIKKHLENVNKLYQKLQRQTEIKTVTSGNNDLVDLLVQMRHKKPAGVEDLGPEDNTPQLIDYGKVFDEEVIANTDHGLCLSMHQPYASLLVAGVKKHEGRTWKTNHRGRLWIAAAAKIPEEDEVIALEDFYRHYYDDQTLQFPRDYPTSCLLGCVYVEDCLDQEAYRAQFPNGESSSPYVLICSNPMILPIFYPVVGQHKIYPLDKELHNCAKLSMRHAQYGVD